MVLIEVDVMIKMLEDIQIDKKDHRIIKNICWKQVAIIIDIQLDLDMEEKLANKQCNVSETEIFWPC